MVASLDWGEFRAEVADLPTGTLHYHRGGTGRALVYLHSAGGPRPSPVVFGLAETREIFALTQPGFDATPYLDEVKEIGALVDLTAAFVRSRFEEPVDLMGESFGGWIALRLASQYPELVDRLVLEAPAGLRDRAPDPPIRIFAREETAPPPSPNADGNVLAAQYYESGRYDPVLAARIDRVVAPTLVLYGTQDELLPEYAARRVEQGIADARLVLIEGAGHGLEYDATDDVLRLVTGFLERGEAPIDAVEG